MHPCVNQSNSSTTPTGFRYVPYTRNHNAQQCNIKVFCKINTTQQLDRHEGFISLSFNYTEVGIYIGAILHELAHVVAAGNVLGEVVSTNAIIEKMIRVIFLVPFLNKFDIFGFTNVGVG